MTDTPTGADAGSVPQGVPEDRCGYTLDTGDFPEDFHAVCCWRPVWNETGRCIWHADVEDKPTAELQNSHTDREERLDGAILRDLAATSFDSLSECRLHRADLTGTTLDETDLTDAFLGGADLTDATLDGADLTDATLDGADLTDTVVTNVEAEYAGFERAVLTRTDFFDTNLTGAQFYGATFDDTKINRGTEFGDPYTEALDEADGDDHSDDEATPWDRAAWSYRQLETLARRNALPEQAREAFENRKDVRRDELWHADSRWSRLKWGRSKLSSMVMRYGESPERVVLTSVVLILGSAILYPFIGGIRVPPASEGARTVVFDLLPTVPISLPTPLAELGTSLYFSVVTFTTLGYGDLQPASSAAQALATIESFLGALLMALLVFVLGRRSTW